MFSGIDIWRHAGSRLDLAITRLIFKTKRYTLFQIKSFGLLSNLVALISMAYVWYSGCLLTVG
ncbi:MAG: hypothetical protein ACI8YQ_004192 [Polaribacter sp.]|jgi:hypothetical protein